MRTDDRRVVNGIFYVLRTGSPWRDLPERYGPYTTVYNRFNRWARRGVWLSVFEALAERSPQSLHLLDSSIVRAHQHAAGGKKGSGSRHWPFSWRTEHQDTRCGRRVGPAGEAPDHARTGIRQDERAGPPRWPSSHRGYDSDAILALATGRGCDAHIPSTARRRAAVPSRPSSIASATSSSGSSGKLEQFRRIATHFDKLARNYLAALHLAATRIWLRQVESTV